MPIYTDGLGISATALGQNDATPTADSLSDVTTTSAQAKVRLILARLAANAFTATIQGAARTELDVMLNTIATYFSASGAAYSSVVDPGGATRTEIETVLEDIAKMLAGGGITTFPAAAAPADAVSLAAVLRRVYDLVALIPTTAMRGTDNAALASVATEGRLAELDAANIPADVDLIKGYTDSLEGAVGAIEGATTLHNKLTAARAALIDQVTALRMAELDAANLPADIDTLLTRLSAARAGYLDELDFDLTARLGTPAGASLAADLVVIDDFVDALETAVGAIEGATTLHNKLTAARAALLDQITALRMAELDAANMPADIDTIKGYLDTEIAAILAAVDAEVAAILADTGTDGVVVNSRTAAYGRGVGVKQILEVSVTSAANAGDVTLATVTTQPCLIKSVVVHADTAAQADLTSAAVAGGASKVVVFLSATDAAVANINAIDEQVAWTGAVRLAATKTIVISLVGTGATAVDLTVTIEYEACVAGGYLA